MKATKLILPSPTESGLQWRQYKGFALVFGDCIDCEVIMGKAVQSSVFTEYKAIGKRKQAALQEAA